MESLQSPQWDTDLELPERCAHLLGGLEAWIKSPTLRELSSGWDNELPSNMTATELFDWYDEFSARHWDRRGGRERNEASSAELTPVQAETAVEAAEVLGLVGPCRPKRSEYDFMLILGGLIRGCMTRPRYARELVHSGIKVRSITALGGFRPLRGDELALAEAMNVTARNEFQAMIAGLKGAFPDLGQERIETSVVGEESNSDWAIASFDDGDQTVIAAPSREPTERRANTADTFAWWAGRVSEARGKHVLLITNPIYVPYQSAVAIENLGIPFDVTVEMAGISASAADLGADTQPFGPSNYLQEIRSAIRGYRSLYDVVARLADGTG
ncbi:MAG TPA: hypothetical protein VGM14_12500 [Streptosporangiaceae bacterium]